MTAQNKKKRIRGIGFIKTRKAITNIHLFIKDMCEVARDLDVYPIGIIVDEGWSRDIDRQDVNRLYQRLEEEELSAVIFQNLHDVADDDDDLCKFMKDMSGKSIMVVDMKTQRVFLPGEEGEGCELDE